VPYEKKGTKVQKLFKAAVIAAISSLALAGCSPATDLKTVVLVTHDSFAMSDELIQKFEHESGYRLKLVKAGDAGAMTTKLILTKDQPIGDAVFGIDNTLIGLAKANDLVAGDFQPIDFGDVCMNYDKDWFASKGVTVPTDIAELTDPTYKNLTVVENPASSSTGMAFLATTVAKFGDPGYLNYWSKLKANGVKVAAGWEDAYFTDFSGSSGHGPYPIVLSYSSSPAYEVRDNGESQTASILNDCYRQTEYAGVLAGAKNAKGAAALVNFMQSQDFQKALPESMYVYPMVRGLKLPSEWEKFAPAATSLVGEQLDVVAGRKGWITAWSQLFE
jgi:thiamine transport system substrate-binding protein